MASEHTMHPIAFHLGQLALPTFGLLVAAGIMLALALSERTAPLAGLAPNVAWDAGVTAVVSAFVLSRLLLVATAPHNYIAFPLRLLSAPSLTPWGLLLTVLVTFLTLRRRGAPLLALLDAWAPCGTLLWAFLALGHWAEGSDPGMPSTLPWAAHLPGVTGAFQPVALYASGAALVLTALLYLGLRSRPSPGRTAAVGLASAGVMQFLLTFLRQPGAALPGGLDQLQGVALLMIVAGGALWLVSMCARKTSSTVPL